MAQDEWEIHGLAPGDARARARVDARDLPSGQEDAEDCLGQRVGPGRARPGRLGQRTVCRAGCGACCRQVVPLAAVFFEAFRKGWGVYLAAITEPDAASAIGLTLLAALPYQLALLAVALWTGVTADATWSGWRLPEAPVLLLTLIVIGILSIITIISNL